MSAGDCSVTTEGDVQALRAYSLESGLATAE
jgi:hypothetical protein